MYISTIYLNLLLGYFNVFFFISNQPVWYYDLLSNFSSIGIIIFETQRDCVESNTTNECAKWSFGVLINDFFYLYTTARMNFWQAAFWQKK